MAATYYCERGLSTSKLWRTFQSYIPEQNAMTDSFLHMKMCSVIVSRHRRAILAHQEIQIRAITSLLNMLYIQPQPSAFRQGGRLPLRPSRRQHTILNVKAYSAPRDIQRHHVP